jgi:hypothetical protein
MRQMAGFFDNVPDYRVLRKLLNQKPVIFEPSGISKFKELRKEQYIHSTPGRRDAVFVCSLILMSSTRLKHSLAFIRGDGLVEPNPVLIDQQKWRFAERKCFYCCQRKNPGMINCHPGAFHHFEHVT